MTDPKLTKLSKQFGTNSTGEEDETTIGHAHSLRDPELTFKSHRDDDKHLIGESLPAPRANPPVGNIRPYSLGESPYPARADHQHATGYVFRHTHVFSPETRQISFTLPEWTEWERMEIEFWAQADDGGASSNNHSPLRWWLKAADGTRWYTDWHSYGVREHAANFHTNASDASYVASAGVAKFDNNLRTQGVIKFNKSYDGNGVEILKAFTFREQTHASYIFGSGSPENEIVDTIGGSAGVGVGGHDYTTNFTGYPTLITFSMTDGDFIFTDFYIRMYVTQADALFTEEPIFVGD